ncbi:hypothetical protein FJV41_41410, partial [Myxococcus llanfairpwllgwyngyllgogerychwyrndrobwllllantysiliogogogochensis]
MGRRHALRYTGRRSMADSSAPSTPSDAEVSDGTVPSPALQRLWFALERTGWAWLTAVSYTHLT